MNNKDAVIAFYTLINRLYSIKFSAQRISNQRKLKQQNGKFIFKDARFPHESWIDAKQSDIARMREEVFSNYNNVSFLSTENFEAVDAELERSKEILMNIHNIFFEKDMSFDEIFDGFVCKSPDFMEFLKIIDVQSFVTNDVSLVHLANAYTEYMQNLFYYTITHTMIDIVAQLQNDVSPYGALTLYNGIIDNDNLTTVSADRLKKYRKIIEEQYKILRKSKQQKKNPQWLAKYNAAATKYFEADVFLLQLEERLKAANTDIINSTTNKIVETTMDFLTGTPTSEKPEITEVYASKLELSYMQYIINVLNLAMQNYNNFLSADPKQKI